MFEALENIPGAGVKAGDQVLSFRSTEFVDDEVRDSQATNSMEISDRGFAFGQISDLRDWVGQDAREEFNERPYQRNRL